MELTNQKKLFNDSRYIIGQLLCTRHSKALKTTDKGNEVESTWYVPGTESRLTQAMDLIGPKRKQKQGRCRHLAER